ncbi:MAG: hypothetical protein FJ087_06815 [Deltaproteobacteria bacterium]|nr:hypothetical protein [Deltaproteobacteria bacterium]
MRGLSLDAEWFDALASVREHAAGSTEAGVAAFRYSLAGCAAVAASNDGAGRPSGAGRLLGAAPAGPADLARFLDALPALAPAREDLAEAARSLAAAHGPGGDVTPAVLAARGSDATAAASRVLLAARLLDAVAAGAAAAEARRTDEVFRVMPNLPISGEQSFPGPTVFPNALLHLSELLRGGVVAEPGLAAHLARLASRAESVLGKAPFPLPVHLAPLPRTGPEGAGMDCRTCPVTVLTVRPEGYGVGARPVIAWSGGRVWNLTGDVLWPGPVVRAGGAEPGDAARAIGAAMAAAAGTIRPIESRLWPGRAPGTALLATFDTGATAGVAREALHAARAAGATSIALLPPGRVGGALPVEVGEAPDGLAPPPDAPRLTVTCAHDTVRVAVERSPAPPALPPAAPIDVKWQSASGFKGKLAATVGQARAAAGAGALVEVRVGDPAASAWILLDVAAEILASDGLPLAGLADRFPGMECGSVCPAALPWFASAPAGPGR